MTLLQEGDFKVLRADEGMHIRNINDVYIPATETEEEHIPYYFTIAYTPLSMTFEEALKLYVEEEIE